MKDTKIRWTDDTWNPMTGCTHISPGCDHCYAEVIAEKFQGGPSSAFPNGFTPTFKPNKLSIPAKTRKARRYFVNSMSDVHHEDFTPEQIDAVYDAMLETPRHHYLLLTKRPNRMAQHLLGGPLNPKATGDSRWDFQRHPDGWLARRGLEEMPGHIWLGTTIESDRYTFRADHLRRIPALVRFLSCEPLIGPLPSLDITGISWVICGGESGNGTKDFRPMPHEWAEDLRDLCTSGPVSMGGAAFFFKQSAAVRTEIGMELDGRRWEEFPLPHPTVCDEYRDAGQLTERPLSDLLGRYVNAPDPLAVSA
jgi:protein gp37